MGTYRNLAHRLARPAAGRGRIQQAARRVLLLLGGEATTRDAAAWAYCRKVQRGQRIEKSDYRHVRRALMTVADPIARVPPYGAWLWRLRNSGEK
jgi:RNase P/RNase MRP subunit POP5